MFFSEAPQYDLLLREAVAEVRQSGVQKDLRDDQVALTLIQIDGTAVLARGAFRGDEGFLTASVVKLFWLAFAGHQLEQRRVRMSEEFQRAARDMIVDSSNDATGYIVNATTGALPGPELPDADFAAWLTRRNAANRWLQSLGYEGINVLHRTYNEGSYGVERQAMGKDLEFRNRLTTNTTARMMVEVMQDKLGEGKTHVWMRSLLQRSIPADDPKADGQSRGYIGAALPSGSKLWSKAGWTSINRHDVAAFDLPDGRRFVLAIFTNYGPNDQIVPALARAVVKRILG